MNVINNSNDGQFLKSKKWLALVMGIVILIISIRFSSNGFGVGVSENDKWIGWALALSVCAAEFMVASDYKKLNLSMIIIGGAAYVYSIYTNVVGFYAFRGMEFHSIVGDYMNLSAGIFLDIFPEVAISWALNESKVGDFVGNLWKAWNKPQEMIGNTTNPNKPIYKEDRPSYSNPQYSQRIEHNSRPDGNRVDPYATSDLRSKLPQKKN